MGRCADVHMRNCAEVQIKCADMQMTRCAAAQMRRCSGASLIWQPTPRECMLPRRIFRECMLRSYTHFLGVYSKYRHDVGVCAPQDGNTFAVYVPSRGTPRVYIPRAITRRKCMFPKHTLLANVYPEQRPGVYAPSAETFWHRDTPRECMPPAGANSASVCLQESHLRTSVCIQKRHTLKVCVSNRGTLRKTTDTQKNIYKVTGAKRSRV